MQRKSQVRNILSLAAGLICPTPWLLSHLGVIPDPSQIAIVVLAGVSILASAFMLSWATELGEQDLPQSFALLVLALVSVLPEYAVDLHFAWMAGKNPDYTHFAVANMTGANRILVGIGWPLVVLIACWKGRKSHLEIRRGENLELRFLLYSTLFAFCIPLGGVIGLFDAFILIAFFVVYALNTLSSEHGETELIGPASLIKEATGDLGRRAWATGFLLYATYMILISAHAFADGLVQIGAQHNIDQFLLVQWVAPLASEAPEFVVAILFALKFRGEVGIGALISSKVNQWTLLVGAIPIAFCLSASVTSGLPLDERQNHEIWLTAAQSLFAVVLASNLKFGLKEALILMALFLVQLFFQETHTAFIGIYVLLSIGMLVFGPADQRQSFLALLNPRFAKRSGAESAEL